MIDPIESSPRVRAALKLRDLMSAGELAAARSAIKRQLRRLEREADGVSDARIRNLRGALAKLQD